jgi:methylmalonyl-CoA mutase
MDHSHSLFSEFPPVSTQEWMDKINQDLKGADFNKKLVWHTNEGFNVQPFYREEDLAGLKTHGELPGKFPYVRGTKPNNSWRIRQKINVCATCIDSAHEKAITQISQGVTAIDFKIDSEAVTSESIAALLNDIDITLVEIHFDTCVMSAVKLVELYVAYVKEKGIEPKRVFGSINFDPIGRRLAHGKVLDNLADRYAAVMTASDYLPKFRTIAINPIYFNNSGAYIYQELGYALAWGNDILAQLEEKGFSAEKVGKKMSFTFGISSNYFMEIAKFRAARFLWSNIVFAYQAKCSKECSNNQPDGMERCASKMIIHAETSQWNMTTFDPYVNMLRSQTETMSAVLAGVDSLTVMPFDTAFKKSDDFSERIARNQQLLLKEESHFDKVVDPGAGSYYIENLTEAIAGQAWKLFLEVEEKGGFMTEVATGNIQAAINTTNTNRRKAIASRREILLGTNQYPNFNEIAGDKIKEASLHACQPKEGTPVLDFNRGAGDFEALRLATEKSGKRPKVFMLTIGSLSMRLARAQFSSNFFGCAGYETIDNLGFDTIDEGVAAAEKAKADIIVLCSSDEEYEILAPQALKAIAGKKLLVVAGAPACMDALKAQSISDFINVRSNVLETLQHFNQQLGIAK